MSRIAKVPISLPKGVQASIGPDRVVTLKGPKGESKINTKGHVTVTLEGDKLRVQRHGDEMADRAFHGLYHRLISTAITGVTEGYTKELELVGVGYKGELKGKDLILNVGKSHEVRYTAPSGIEIKVPNPTRVVVSGSSKQGVGQEAARIRAFAPPEPYKGKGIRYVGEQVRRKVGKTGTK